MALLPQWISKLRGTTLDIFGLGGPSGINIKNDSGTLVARNDDDTTSISVRAAGIEIEDTGSGDSVVLIAPTLASGNVTLTLPDDDGAPGEFLQTNGSGVLSWAASSSNADITDETAFDQSSGTLAMFTPPANALIKSVQVVVDSAAAAGTPSILVGISGDTDKYLEAGDVDLHFSAQFQTSPLFKEDGTPDAIIATVVASAQTFSGRIYTTYGVPV